MYSFIGEAKPWPTLKICSPLDSNREKLEQYIAHIFQTSYDARVFEYLPMLLSLELEGSTSAALGISHASRQPLFCESYLKHSAEDTVKQVYERDCERLKIMELGNLAVSVPRHSALLYVLAVAAMQRAGIEFLFFAANRKVRASIKRSGLTPISICKAKQESLGERGACWGSYYEGDPEVMIADIRLTMNQAMAQPLMQKQLSGYSSAINQLASHIRQYR